MAIYCLGEDRPQLAADCWVADSATVLGRVSLGAAASVWYGAVLRGDNDLITLGDRCNVQDGAVLHTDTGFPLRLEDEVSVGHQVMLHGCDVGTGSLIGIGSVVLNGARIGRHCLVGARSLITEGKEFPDGALIVGSPAKVVRMLTPEQIASLDAAARHYVVQAARHRQAVRLDV
ncbi:MAG: gamma carbonic anhydrase family protein [Rubrivivax sp.]|nr:gamma carbonic anhydrase family protein [Rubrivivax sp.]